MFPHSPSAGLEAMDTNAPYQPRVMHLDDGRYWRGGQHQVWLLMGELARFGIRQRLIAREGCPLTIRARQIGIDVDTIRFGGELDMIGPRRIAALARACGANLIHAHTSHAHTLGRRVVRRLGPTVRLVVTRRVDFPIGLNPFSRRKYTDPRVHFIAISEGVRGVLRNGGVHDERIDLVPSGVPPIPPAEALPREQARRKLGIQPREIAIVNIGALTDHKGQRWLVEAAPKIVAAFPDARIHILGEGELREALQRKIQTLRLERRVILHGYIENARNLLSAFDLLVSSSHLEGLGTTILDAMHTGLPVVAAAAGGVPEIVIAGRTGRLVPPRHPQALARATLEALNQPEASRRMARQAQSFVAEHFSEQAMAAGTLAVYQRLLAPQPVSA